MDIGNSEDGKHWNSADARSAKHGEGKVAAKYHTTHSGDSVRGGVRPAPKPIAAICASAGGLLLAWTPGSFRSPTACKPAPNHACPAAFWTVGHINECEPSRHIHSLSPTMLCVNHRARRGVAVLIRVCRDCSEKRLAPGQHAHAALRSEEPISLMRIAATAAALHGPKVGGACREGARSSAGDAAIA